MGNMMPEIYESTIMPSIWIRGNNPVLGKSCCYSYSRG
jgi:hypothetical protein